MKNEIRQIPCPDNIPGCCVLHYENIKEKDNYEQLNEIERNIKNDRFFDFTLEKFHVKPQKYRG